MKTTRALLFARVRELAGVESVEVPLATGDNVATLRRVLASRLPGVAELLPRCAIAVNGEYADDSVSIPPNAELAVIPPVSGG